MYNNLNFFIDNSDSDSDWDDDNVEAYNPSQKAAQMHILPQGLTPAQRKEFRMARRQGDLPEFMREQTPEWSMSQSVPKTQQNKNPNKKNTQPAGINKPVDNGNKEIPMHQRGLGRGKKPAPPPPGK